MGDRYREGKREERSLQVPIARRVRGEGCFLPLLRGFESRGGSSGLELDACSDLSFAGARELIESLGRRNAAKAAQSLAWIVGVGDLHVRGPEVDVVQDVHKRCLNLQRGVFGEPEALGKPQVPIDSAWTLHAADACCSETANGRMGG